MIYTAGMYVLHCMVTAVLDEVILPVSLLAISIGDRICVNTVKLVSQPVRTHLETTMNAEKNPGPIHQCMIKCCTACCCCFNWLLGCRYVHIMLLKISPLM